MQQGRELRDKGDLKEALKRFKGADESCGCRRRRSRSRKSQVALGQLVEARDTIAAIRQMPPKHPDDPPPFKEARAKADELDVSLNGRVPRSIIIKGAASGEQAAYHRRRPGPAGALGLPRAVDPGHHVVDAKTAQAEGKRRSTSGRASRSRWRSRSW